MSRRPTRSLARALMWLAAVVCVPVLLAGVFIASGNCNWLRGPIERLTLEKTGRALAINGDLRLKIGWPLSQLHAAAVTFANPAWASEAQMVSADAVEVAVDLPQLLQRNFVLPEVRLERPVVFLERGSGGRKNWLLDLEQRDETARVRVGRLRLDHGRLGYDDAESKTRIRSELSTSNAPAEDGADASVSFRARGQYLGLAFSASGSGGPVLALRDESVPYPLNVEATVGRTRVWAVGSITSLLKFSTLDLRLALSGDSLEQLYPLLGIVFPATRAYATEGQLLHSGTAWRYEGFSGRIGDSDIAGSFQLDTGGKRPAARANLVSKLLDVADLGPLIGARPGQLRAARRAAPEPSELPSATPSQARVLPDLPFKAERWQSVNAEVDLRARTLRRAEELPLEDFVTHLSLRDSVLRLDPLEFGIAGGRLGAVISLDGRGDPIQAQAQLQARNILMAKLLPTVELNRTSVGQINGYIDLTGKGNSVGRMLATSNGKVALVIADGEISQLMMEKVSLHLWEILKLTLFGDKLVKLHCAVADADVKAGSMQANALIFDTEVNTIVATGSIDLGRETLDLTLNPSTKHTTAPALRSPIYLRGSFAKPEVAFDRGRLAARALGSVALGTFSPALALIPLVDAGPGRDSDCAQRLSDARAVPRSKDDRPGNSTPRRRRGMAPPQSVLQTRYWLLPVSA